MMTEVKTNTTIALPEMSPNNWRLPDNVDDEKVIDDFDDIVRQEEEYIKDPQGFITRTQILIDDGDPGKAMKRLEVADSLTDRDESRKVATIKFKRAEATQKYVDSGAVDKTTGEEMLDDALVNLKLYEQYDKTAREKELKFKLAGKVAYLTAEKQHRLADTGTEDIKSVRLPLLDESEKNLNISNNYYRKAHSFENNGFEFTPTPNKKRGFRLGAKAVINTFKSTIKSTLNRRS